MKSVFVINEKKECIGNIDFKPNISEKIIVGEIVLEVDEIIHNPKKNAILVFCNDVTRFYCDKTKNIKW